MRRTKLDGMVPITCRRKACREALSPAFRNGYWTDENFDLFDSAHTIDYGAEIEDMKARQRDEGDGDRFMYQGDGE